MWQRVTLPYPKMTREAWRKLCAMDGWTDSELEKTVIDCILTNFRATSRLEMVLCAYIINATTMLNKTHLVYFVLCANQSPNCKTSAEKKTTNNGCNMDGKTTTPYIDAQQLPSLPCYGNANCVRTN